MNSLVTAVPTPFDREFHPDGGALVSHCRTLLRNGCDGIALFGTTGEGLELSVEDRSSGLEFVIRSGIDPKCVMTSVTALALPDVVRLARHALDCNAAGLLLMPPCAYRQGITEEGTFRFFATVIDRVGRQDLRLYLYHFPDICGYPISPKVIRRLDEKYPGTIAGVKDSGGDFDFTDGLLRRFAHLSIYTGSEIHIPQAMTRGARGTICGLANVAPRLFRQLFDLPSEFDRRPILPLIRSVDAVMSRGAFIAAVKAVLADATDEEAWLRTIPPMMQLALRERQWIVRDFRRWENDLPVAYRSFSLASDDAADTVVPMRWR